MRNLVLSRLTNFTLKMKVGWYSEALVSYHTINGVTTQNTMHEYQ